MTRLQKFGQNMFFFTHEEERLCVDATEESDRLGRFLNHSKTHNKVHTKAIITLDDRPVLILIAKRQVAVGEELCIDYGDRKNNSLGNHPWLKQ